MTLKLKTLADIMAKSDFPINEGETVLCTIGGALKAGLGSTRNDIKNLPVAGEYYIVKEATAHGVALEGLPNKVTDTGGEYKFSLQRFKVVPNFSEFIKYIEDKELTI